VRTIGRLCSTGDSVEQEGLEATPTSHRSRGVKSPSRRCTPAGRVLNQRYKTTEAVDRMQADFKLVSG